MSGAACEEGSWTEPSSGRAFHYQLWRPLRSRRLLVLVHGFGEHSGRYQPIGESLAAEGVCVAAFDLWGHGRSGGRRGDILSVARCVADGRRLTEDVFLPRSGQSRYALFGHSFGGLVAIQWAMTNPAPLQRVVIQSPLLEVGFPLPAWKTLAAKLLARGWPTCSFAMGLDVSKLSHDAAVVEAYRVDPLVHNAMRARSYTSILQARDNAMARAQAMRRPLLLLCGAEDTIISVAAAQRWFDRLTCQKRSVVFPGCYHELHHEPVREEVLRLVQEWTVADDDPS